MTQDDKKKTGTRFNKLFSFFKKKETVKKGETSDLPKATEHKSETVQKKSETGPDKASKPVHKSVSKAGAVEDSDSFLKSSDVVSSEKPISEKPPASPKTSLPVQKSTKESEPLHQQTSASPQDTKEDPSQGDPQPSMEISAPLSDRQTADPKPVKEEKLVDPPVGSIKLGGLFAFKMSMTTFYNEQGQAVPVTALRYEPCRVAQVKTKEKDSYSAVQLAFVPQKNKRCKRPLVQHLKAGGFHEGARFARELRQKNLPSDIKPGQVVDIESLKKGDSVKISALSKGRGFAGVMKRWGFAGGKASHGSKTHRGAGSIGQCAEPGRVMPGRKMPGQYGFKKVSRLKVPVVDVLTEENMIFVKGPVPGARNTLVAIKKMSSASRAGASA